MKNRKPLAITAAFMGVFVLLSLRLGRTPPDARAIWLPMLAPENPAELDAVYQSDTNVLVFCRDGFCKLCGRVKCGFSLDPSLRVSTGSWSIVGSRITLEPTNAFGRFARLDTLRATNGWVLLAVDPAVSAAYRRSGISVPGCFIPWESSIVTPPNPASRSNSP